jgi:mycofactocin glycosyltransferase
MTPLPAGFRIRLDPTTRTFDNGRLLVGGRPVRAFRLTDLGRQAISSLQRRESTDHASLRLARRLVDSGIAHPIAPAKAPLLDVTVVVPVRDRPGDLDRCLDAIRLPAPVIVVDDGSLDPDAIARVCHDHGAKLIRLHANLGPGTARNVGLAEAESDIVAFVDSDVVTSPEMFRRLLIEFLDPTVGAVAPRVVPAATARPNLTSRFTRFHCPLDMGTRAGYVGSGLAVPYVPTATLLVRKETRLAFDPALSLGEDVDFVWRLAASGWRIRFVPDAVVHHVEPQSWMGLLRRRFRYGRSSALLARRYPERLRHIQVPRWGVAMAGILCSDKPVLAGVVPLAVVARRARRMRHVGLPKEDSLRWASSTVLDETVGFGRALTMLALPLLLGATVSNRLRALATTLVVLPPVVEWSRKHPPISAPCWIAASIADDVAYGAGVIYGCITATTAAPLRPILS